MDSLPSPPDPGAIDTPVNFALWMCTALMSAATMTLRKATSIKVAAYHMLLATLVAPAAVLVAFWYNPTMPRWWGLVISLGVGLTIFAWAVWLEKINKRIGDADPALVLQNKLDGILPKSPPENKS